MGDWNMLSGVLAAVNMIVGFKRFSDRHMNIQDLEEYGYKQVERIRLIQHQVQHGHRVPTGLFLCHAILCSINKHLKGEWRRVA